VSGGVLSNTVAYTGVHCYFCFADNTSSIADKYPLSVTKSGDILH